MNLTTKLKLISILETLDSMTPEQVKALTPELRKLRETSIYHIEMKLLRDIDGGINEKDDHFWTDLGKTFLGL